MAEVSDAIPSLRVLALGELSGESTAPERVLPIDRERLEEALATLAPQLHLSVPNRLGTPGATLELDLRFTGWTDFTPAGLIEQIFLASGPGKSPDLHARLLQELAPHLEQTAEPPPAEAPRPSPPPASATRRTPATPPGEEASVDSILELVAQPEVEAADAQATARRLIDAVTSRPRAAKGQARSSSAVIAQLDERIGAQLDEILHAPAFRALEASWRGLRFLVSRTNFREPIALDVRSVSAEDAPAALEAAAALEDYDFVLVDHAFDASPRDHEQVVALAQAGERAQTPVVAALLPEFFGLESWAELRKGRAPHATFEEAPYAAWRSLREDECARWLVLVANRIALRAAYGPEGESTRGVAYVEGGAERAGLLGSGVWAVGTCLTRAFERTGACVQISGTRHGLLPDLALLATGNGGTPVPVEGVFPNERREDLERIGIAAIQHYQRDIAFVGTLRTFRKPERYPDAEATADAAQHVTLAYQLYASRLAKFLGVVLPELVGLGSTEEVERALKERVIRFLSAKGAPLPANRVGVAAAPSEQDPALTELKLRVGPELRIAGREVNVLFRFAARI